MKASLSADEPAAGGFGYVDCIDCIDCVDCEVFEGCSIPLCGSAGGGLGGVGEFAQVVADRVEGELALSSNEPA